MVQFSAKDDPQSGPGGGLRDVNSKPSLGVGSGETFTVKAANQMLPLITRIVADLMTLSVDLEEQSEQIRGIESLPTPNKISAFADELKAIKESFSADRQRLVACHRELFSLGVKIDSLSEGVIDFPAFLNRRPVMLCWKLGEATVTHWHQINESYKHRREIGAHCFDPAPPSVV